MEAEIELFPFSSPARKGGVIDLILFLMPRLYKPLIFRLKVEQTALQAFPQDISAIGGFPALRQPVYPTLIVGHYNVHSV